MKQRLDNVLAVSFTCLSSINVGDVVTISANNTVVKLAEAGSLKVVGTVCKHGYLATSCTVETRFRERRDDRVSGAACAVGPFVFDANGKVIAYSAASHDPSAIRGLVIKASTDADQVVETLEL